MFYLKNCVLVARRLSSFAVQATWYNASVKQATKQQNTKADSSQILNLAEEPFLIIILVPLHFISAFLGFSIASMGFLFLSLRVTFTLYSKEA
jgi:hypothetical protein